jgi:N-acetylglucosamine kinase-like BadF-type ATPase
LDVVLGVDGGNSKTELVAATLDGKPLSYIRGPGSNSHAVGADGCIAVVRDLVERAHLMAPADCGAFFLCGADMPSDLVELTEAVNTEQWVRRAIVDNDTFALLRTGANPDVDAVAVICGSGINCVGRAADGRVARYPSLGWETGDWGGSGMLGREVLFHAARAEDGRGEPTMLMDVVREHFGMPTIEAVGEAVHYRRFSADRLGELAPAVIEAAEHGDAVARALLERLAEEVALMARRALSDLELLGRPADVVLGGGMLRRDEGVLWEEITARLRAHAPRARPVLVAEPPVLGAALAALDAVGAPAMAEEQLRAAFRDGFAPEDVRDR